MNTKRHNTQNGGAKPFWLDLLHLSPFHLPPSITTLALTLFITLKGCGTGILHLGGPTKLLTLHILCHYISTDKGWGTGVLHLGGPTKLLTFDILSRYISTEKSWGTSVLHLGGLTRLHGQIHLHNLQACK